MVIRPPRWCTPSRCSGRRREQSKWRIAVEKGFAPLTVGLILASSLVMSRAADHDWRAYTLTAICTLIFVRTKINPLIVVAVAGLIGLLRHRLKVRAVRFHLRIRCGKRV